MRCPVLSGISKREDLPTLLAAAILNSQFCEKFVCVYNSLTIDVSLFPLMLSNRKKKEQLATIFHLINLHSLRVIELFLCLLFLD